MGKVLTDTERYHSYLIESEKKFESLCKRCGQCCGALADPCEHLAKGGDNRYSCGIYENRPGRHKTVSNKPFTCVPIKSLIAKRALPPGCAYLSTK